MTLTIKTKPEAGTATVSDYLIKIARLGGYLNRASDPPPGSAIVVTLESGSPSQPDGDRQLI